MAALSRRILFVALLALAVSPACGDDTPTTPTPTTPARSAEIFGGTIDVGGSQFYSFSVSQAGTTEVTLLSLRPAGVATSTVDIAVGLGLGTPAGTECALSSAITATPALTKQLSVTTQVSTYCVKIADIGGLTAPLDYTVRILHP